MKILNAKLSRNKKFCIFISHEYQFTVIDIEQSSKKNKISWILLENIENDISV
jgi:hypothetical protein